MENQNLYFVAIVLPDELCEKIVEIQSEIADRFNSRKSLKVVPHITLKAPFTLPEFAHIHLLNWFANLIVKIPSFQVNLEDFGAFKNTKQPVIYIKPIANEALTNLQKLIVQEFYRTFEDVQIGSSELVYKPHVTVAYRDLKPEMFERAWPEFEIEKFSGTFLVNGFQLLKHDGKMWHIIEHHQLT